MLRDANPIIDWKPNRTILRNGDRLVTLDAECRKHGASLPTYMPTGKLFARFARKRNTNIYYVLVKSSQENDGEISVQSPEIKKLLKECEETFPDELQKGLPPKEL